MDGPARLTCRAGTARANNSRAGVYLSVEDGMKVDPGDGSAGSRQANPWRRVEASSTTWTPQ